MMNMESKEECNNVSILILQFKTIDIVSKVGNPNWGIWWISKTLDQIHNASNWYIIPFQHIEAITREKISMRELTLATLPSFALHPQIWIQRLL